MNVMHQDKQGRIGRLGWLGLMLVGIGLVVILFFVKTNALEAKSELRKLERTLAHTQAEIRIINAEIAHLESPERLRKLASEHLGLEPVSAERTLSLAEAVKLIPAKPPKSDETVEPHQPKGGK
ncbi:MAG: hypothetical protein COA43_06795 [Robiginitomaculum sp.]|nr:MAG: hypothetical protein COA43_06795 [Robiginitomaculum sp.]